MDPMCFRLFVVLIPFLLIQCFPGEISSDIEDKDGGEDVHAFVYSDSSIIVRKKKFNEILVILEESLKELEILHDSIEGFLIGQDSGENFNEFYLLGTKYSELKVKSQGLRNFFVCESDRLLNEISVDYKKSNLKYYIEDEYDGMIRYTLKSVEGIEGLEDYITPKKMFVGNGGHSPPLCQVFKDTMDDLSRKILLDYINISSDSILTKELYNKIIESIPFLGDSVGRISYMEKLGSLIEKGKLGKIEPLVLCLKFFPIVETVVRNDENIPWCVVHFDLPSISVLSSFKTFEFVTTQLEIYVLEYYLQILNQEQ